MDYAPAQSIEKSIRGLFSIMRRLRLVLARWLSLFCCGIVAGAIVVGVEPELERLTAPLADRKASLGSLAATIVTAVLVAAVGWFAGARRWRCFLVIRHFFSLWSSWLCLYCPIDGH